MCLLWHILAGLSPWYMSNGPRVCDVYKTVTVARNWLTKVRVVDTSWWKHWIKTITMFNLRTEGITLKKKRRIGIFTLFIFEPNFDQPVVHSRCRKESTVRTEAHKVYRRSSATLPYAIPSSRLVCRNGLCRSRTLDLSTDGKCDSSGYTRNRCFIYNHCTAHITMIGIE